MNRVEVNLPGDDMGVLRFENIQRGGALSAYTAEVVLTVRRATWHHPRRYVIGYVQRERGAEEHRAYVGGKLVGSDRSLVGLRYEIREALEAGEWDVEEEE